MYRLKIEHDNDALNPRVDGHNADIMFCKHHRYNLGDKDADDPMERVEIITLEYPGGPRYELESAYDEDGYSRDDAPELNWESVLAMLKEHAEEAADDANAPPEPDEAPDAQQVYDATLERAQAGYDYVRDLTSETVYCERPGIALIRPLSLYDHSGITIFAGAPTCRWDSGQVGWQYITDKALADKWNGDRELATKYMDATLETYDDYLTGNVHGYTVEKGTLVRTTRHYPDGREVEETEIEWDLEDSCWGFYGDWWREGDPTGMGDNFDGELKALFDSMDYNDVGEWHYTASVPEELQCD